ncbi:MAG: HAD-IC family P-type ATPase [Candidatus Portnoybacteria bacterium]|nr:HAD-IC family P-type ATPase [Candidatus Portnoybacteria bacterium]
MTSPKQNWHNLTASEVLKKTNTTKKGLTQEEAQKRLRKFGLNALPEEKPLSKAKIFLEQFKSPLIYILVIAGFVTLALQDWTDSVVIFAAVFLNAFIGYFQENKTSQILSKLKKAVRDKAIVIRNGKEKEISQNHVIMGDIIVLKAGDKVPADARIIENYSLKINEAALTGEWLASEKTIKKLPKGTPLADRKNMVYMGTIIESGRGLAVVTGIGIKTEIGKVATSLSEVEKTETPYQKKIAKFSKIVAIAVGAISLALFIAGAITGRDTLEMFVTAVAVAVAAIPEGLPIAITVILALGMERILRKKGLVRRLVAAEVLGSTSVICTDKTGTLTEAKMQVTEIFSLKENPRIIKKALKAGVACSEAFIENVEDPMHKWIIRGRPTEKAIIKAGIQEGITKEKLKKQEPQIDSLPFSPEHKYSASVHSLEKTQDIIYMLGAPEIILEKATHIEGKSRKKKLTKKEKEKLKKKFEKLNSKGLRLIAASYKKIKKDEFIKQIKKQEEIGEISEEQKQGIYEKHLEEMVFIAFIAIKDPLRARVKQAVKTCKQAGMRPIIVTGDHALTARAIAEELGIPAESKNVIEGKDFNKITDKEFKKRLKDITIYARVEPQQKLRIVEAWQKNGEVVAMTGDGVNDAPALKKANIGVALGSGTDVAKEASDLVLLSDNFYVIVTAVKEGRTIIDNIRKVITYLFSFSFTEMILIGASIIGTFPLPVLPAQILWVNLIQDSFPAIALGFEKEEKDIMKRKPEEPESPLLNREMKVIIFAIGIFTDLLLLGLFFWLLDRDMPLEEIRTVIFAGLSVGAIFFTFPCRSLRKNIWEINPFSNKTIILAWIISIITLLAAVYIPIFQKLLKTVPLNPFDWLLFIAIGIINLILIEIAKLFFKKKS